MTDKEKQIATLHQDIINLQTRLSSSESDLGDWKISKTYEARLQNEEDPYDTDQLLKDRQAVRDKINAKQAELAELEAE